MEICKTMVNIKMSVTKMRMLRWMCGKTRKDNVRNEDIHHQVGIAPIEDKLRENYLRWFGYIGHVDQEMHLLK